MRAMDAMIRLAAAFVVLAVALRLCAVVVVLVRLRPSRRVAIADGPAVSLVRPVSGLENFLEPTLRSSFALSCPRYEILFCAARETDAAVPLVRKLIAQHPGVRAQLLIGNDVVSANPKLNNIVKGWRAARHDWIVLADSNVLLPADYIQQLLATWDDATGLVSSPPVGGHPSGFWAELECAFLNGHQAAWQCLADALGVSFAQGKTMLWRRDIVEDAGGIAVLGREAAEDAAATKLVRAAGLHVRLTKRLFEQPLGRRTLDDVWKRQLRWARLRRGSFTLAFAAEILTGSVPPLVAIGAVAAASGWPVGPTVAGLAILWYGAEAALTAFAGWPISRRSPAQWMLRDLLLPVLWVAAWAGKDFVWRGNAMHLSDRAGPA
jgi:ceramide glucosyltransferase